MLIPCFGIQLSHLEEAVNHSWYQMNFFNITTAAKISVWGLWDLVAFGLHYAAGENDRFVKK